MLNARSFGMIVAALAMLIGSSTQAALVGHWAMEEGTGFTTADSSGNGNTANFVPANASGPQWINSGLAPSLSGLGGTTAAINFDGNGDHLAVTGFKGVTGTQARTVSAWIRTSNIGGIQDDAIVSWGNNATGQKWTFRIQSGNGQNGAIRAEVNGGFFVGNTVVTDGEWHHVAVTWEDDGTPNIEDAKLYVDGLLDADLGVLAPSAFLAQAMNTASSDDVRFGEAAGNNLDWNGDLDEISIFDTALSAGQIKALAGIVPEPTTAVLGLMGLAGMGLRRRRSNV